MKRRKSEALEKASNEKLEELAKFLEKHQETIANFDELDKEIIIFNYETAYFEDLDEYLNNVLKNNFEGSLCEFFNNLAVTNDDGKTFDGIFERDIYVTEPDNMPTKLNGYNSIKDVIFAYEQYTTDEEIDNFIKNMKEEYDIEN